MNLVEMLLDLGLVPARRLPLRDIVVSNNPYVQAALELYGSDGDAEDLADTLLRLVPEGSDDGAELANAVYAKQQLDRSAWASTEGARRLISALTEEELFSEAAGVRLDDLLTVHFGTSQQQVLVAAYEIYEQDGDVSEFVDTCVRVLQQIEELASKHANAFALIISDSNTGSFSSQAQDVLMSLWHVMDPRVMAAWDVYLEDRQLSELVDTLSRIIALEFSIEEAHDSEEEAEPEEAASGTTPSPEVSADFVAVMNNVMELMIEEGHTDHEGIAVLMATQEESRR